MSVNSFHPCNLDVINLNFLIVKFGCDWVYIFYICSETKIVSIRVPTNYVLGQTNEKYQKFSSENG